MKNQRTIVSLFAVATAGALALTGCASSDAGGSSSNAADSALPASVRDSGVLRIGAAVGFPPYQFFADDGTTVIGYEPDLMDLVGEELGVSAQFENTSFAALFSSLKTGRFDIAMNGLTVSEDRMAENDMIAYAKDGYGLLTKAGEADKIGGIEDVCGLRISVLRASKAEAWAQELSAGECADNPVQVLSFDEGSQALLAVSSGQADATSAQTAQLLYYEKGDPERYEYVDSVVYSEGYVGIVIPKGQDEFVEVLTKALQNTIDSGSYAEVMKEWNLEPLMVDEIVVNPPLS